MITDERVVSHNALNRRTFLKASAAAIASSAVLETLGSSQRELSPKKKIPDTHPMS